MLRLLICLLAFWSSQAFGPTFSARPEGRVTALAAATSADTPGTSNMDASEIVARRIIVKGDVQGGYYRSCVRNEGGRFRKLVGTMSPPEEDVDEAEIYVEGKLKVVEGFIRWLKRGDVGLSQQATVSNVIEEEPTGLYDGFYVKTK